MKNVLVAIDFSAVTPAVVQHAADMGRAFGGHLLIIHVAAPNPEFVGYESGPQVVRDQMARHWHEEHRQLQVYAERLNGEGITTKALLIQGATLEKILEEASRIRADLIVIGSHGHGALHHMILGSVSDGVLRKATCPVLIVPSRNA